MAEAEKRIVRVTTSWKDRLINEYLFARFKWSFRWCRIMHRKHHQKYVDTPGSFRKRCTKCNWNWPWISFIRSKK